MVVTHKGHIQYFCGVPDRVYEANPDLRSNSSVVLAERSLDLSKDDEALLWNVLLKFGDPGANPADYLYIFDEDLTQAS